MNVKKSVTFKSLPGGGFKVVKAINTTRHLPGQFVKEVELKDLVKNAPRDFTYIIT